jgi:thymidylate synthase
MNNLDKQYQALLQDILDNGVAKQDRTGTGTLSVFGRQIRHNMKEGFPLLTTKKMAWKSIVVELLWFLRGDTNIKYLVDNDCHIWDGDAYKNYERRWETEGKFLSPPVNKFTKEELINEIKTNPMVAKELGELGPIYGKQWRNWETYQQSPYDTLRYNKKHPSIDQIANLINDLKTNPDSRRLMVNAWNVGELDQMVLPPCHYGFQVYTRELSWQERFDIHKKYLTEDKLDLLFEFATNENLDSLGVPKRAISLMWNQRSVDTFLGLPFNIASYGLLLEIIAKEVNMVPDELIGNLGDVHLYSNHVEQAKEQIGRRYDFKEREKMLKEAMGEEGYKAAIKDLAPFGGGMSEYYTIYKIPSHTRHPYPLPKLNIMGNISQNLGTIPFDEVVRDMTPHDFVLENYQSHPLIKAPLSN